MAEILVRQAVSPDIEILSRFDHSIRTPRVWQMNQNIGEDEIQTAFKETTLPRDLRLKYPRSPETLMAGWKNFSSILVGCVDNAPVAYITLSTMFISAMVWVKDLVVEEHWRRKGIATTLVRAATDWATARDYFRMTIEMSSKNYPSICLVKKLGFEYSGFNDNYFTNNDLAVFFARNKR